MAQFKALPGSTSNIHAVSALICTPMRPLAWAKKLKINALNDLAPCTSCTPCTSMHAMHPHALPCAPMQVCCALDEWLLASHVPLLSATDVAACVSALVALFFATIASRGFWLYAALCTKFPIAYNVKL